jgi:hypothetical protein
MRFVGIDIASETHVVAAVSEDQQVVLKPVSFTEDAAGCTSSSVLGLLDRSAWRGFPLPCAAKPRCVDSPSSFVPASSV